VKHKVEAHLREKRFIEKLLPVTRWVVELTNFDIHKITNPDVVDYQNGDKKGFYNVKAFVLNRDGYKCQKCKKQNCKLHVHHIVFRSNGGTNTSENLTTLCEGCHGRLHSGEFALHTRRSKTKHAMEINIVASQLRKSDWLFEETFGYETKFKREKFGLPKTHYFDAVSICCKGKEVLQPLNVVLHRRCVSKGDYKQTIGRRSEMRIPTGKLFGLRKFDLIETVKGTGFVKGKRSNGQFVIEDVCGKVLIASVNVKRSVRRLSARKIVLIERRSAFIPVTNNGIYCA